MMVSHTRVAIPPLKSETQPWSPEVFQDLLSWMESDGAVTPLIASSNSSDSCTFGEGSSNTSSPTFQPSESILLQTWQPCTGDVSIGNYLDIHQFPVSYRQLVYSWEKAGQPVLRTLRVPLSVHIYGASASASSMMNLQTITECQERAVISAVERHIRQGPSASRSMLFVSFASHLDIYSAVQAELMALQHGWDQERQARAYEHTWNSLLDAFEGDRSICAARETHDCISRLLWGEISSWPLMEIKRRFIMYKVRSLGTPTLSASTTMTSFGATDAKTVLPEDHSDDCNQTRPDSPESPYLQGSNALSLSITPTQKHDSLDWFVTNDLTLLSPTSSLYDFLPHAGGVLDTEPSKYDASTYPQQHITYLTASQSVSIPNDLSLHVYGTMPTHQGDVEVAEDVCHQQMQVSAESIAAQVPKDTVSGSTWMQQCHALLHEATVQLKTAAELLSARKT